MWAQLPAGMRAHALEIRSSQCSYSTCSLSSWRWGGRSAWLSVQPPSHRQRSCARPLSACADDGARGSPPAEMGVCAAAPPSVVWTPVQEPAFWRLQMALSIPSFRVQTEDAEGRVGRTTTDWFLRLTWCRQEVELASSRAARRLAMKRLAWPSAGGGRCGWGGPGAQRLSRVSVGGSDAGCLYEENEDKRDCDLHSSVLQQLTPRRRRSEHKQHKRF